MKSVEIYTDGACHKNPGPGGFGVILVYEGRERELSCGYRRTTNNRMELSAAIAGLSALTESCRVTLYSDSKYLVDAMTRGWLDSWVKRGWVKSDRKPVLNIDLWKKIISLCDKHEVKFVWVRGHDGHEYNERCDALAVAASDNPTENDEEMC